MGDRLSAYRDALDYLFVRTTGQWRFGLERTRALLAELGNPQDALRIVHVGGTNGKGSVCAMLEGALRARGFRVAKYTSPHLVDFRERFIIDGAPVSEDAVTDFIREWTPAVERIGATFFEATTAMAFALFARAEPDIAIVEVGLGGRLDATNVIDPLLSIVTNIGIDHTEYLGDTRAQIASEKAGIFKEARTAVIGERDRAIVGLLARSAKTAGAGPVDVVGDSWCVGDVAVANDGTRFTIGDGKGATQVHTGLVGAHQAMNAAVALRALELLPPPFSTPHRAAAASLEGVRLGGRFDQRGARIFDVAHNRAGAEALVNTLRAVSPRRPRAVVLSILGDKDWRGMMATLAPEVDLFILTTAPTAPASRKWDPADAAREAEANGWPARLEADFDKALALGGREGATQLVTGSFHTVGDAMMRLHVSPLAG